jgi:hypothetical protein
MLALILALMMPPGPVGGSLSEVPQLDAAQAWRDHNLRPVFGLSDTAVRLHFEYSRMEFGSPDTTVFEETFAGLRTSIPLGDRLELFGQAGLTQSVVKGSLASVTWGSRLMVGVAWKLDPQALERPATRRSAR